MASQQDGSPSGERLPLPETITAGGVTRWLTRHLRNNPHPDITADGIQHVLENWIVRGICTNSAGSTTITFWGFVPGRRAMLRVTVSLDDEEIITATFDSRAARRVRQEGRPWFQRHCQNLEVRDGS